MKALSMRISAGIIALGALLYILACSGPSGNINQNQNMAEGGNKALMGLDECKVPTNSTVKAGEIRDRLKGAITNSNLADGLKPDANSSRGTFTVEVQYSKDNYFEAYIKGEVRGDNNLKILSNIVNDYQDDESDCLRVVHFQELNATSATSGFKWSSCPYPKHVCTNGVCCDDKDTNSNGNTNSNTNTNSDTLTSPTTTPSPRGR